MSQPFDGSETKSPFQTKGFILSAVVLAFLLLAGAFGAVMIFGGDDRDDNAAPAASPSAAASASASPADGACPAFQGADTSTPSTGPDADWALFRTVALPSSASAGPAVSDGDLKRCFAHTPTGALIAAVQISNRSMLASNWPAVWTEQTYGAAKNAQLAALKKQFGTAPLPAPDPGELGQIAGFHFVTYSADTAVIELLTRFTDGSLRVNTASLRWHAGDWQLEVSDTAQQRNAASEEGFVTWGGV